ncbi:hypothetical protein IWX90DRAFT_502725 [Phyllosticta citrichinensis]|uniref:Uncharacterized protein n=1 Tax=Phyllosticta citrichinensis TaxID=1130410 RepID=A0ABR1XSS1_9PEZI
MRIYIGLCLLIWTLQTAYAAITEANIKTYPNSFALEFPFKGIKDLYWTGMKTHRRVCFAASPTGKVGFVAYLDASGKGVHVQQPSAKLSLSRTGEKAAGGLVVPDDEVGFALLTNEPLAPGTADAPKDNAPIPVLYRVVGGNIAWKTYLAGPGVHPEEGLGKAVDMNGDLVWSPTKRLFAAYFVISYYTGKWATHFADSIEYVDPDGKLQIIDGATSGGGCSHNTGIAFAEADNAPFCSACSEDQQGGIWLNTKTQNAGPPSPLLSKEPFINGMSGEPFNGMGGSWKVLARLGKTQYSGETTTGGEQPQPQTKQPTTETNTETKTDPNAVKPEGTRLQQQNTEQSTDHTGNTGAKLRFVRRATTKKTKTGVGGGGGAPPRNVAIAILTDKFTVGAKNIITKGPADHFNAHVQAFDDKTILSTYEEITSPRCVKAAGCLGQFTGTYFAQVDTEAKVVGEPFKSTEITVGGDLVLLPSGSICFPFVAMKWDYSTKYDAAPQDQVQQDPLTESKMTTENTGGGGGGIENGGGVRFRLFRRQQTQQTKMKPSSTTGGNKITVPFNGGGGVGGHFNPLPGGSGGGASGTQQLSFACVSPPNGGGGGGTTTTKTNTNADREDVQTEEIKTDPNQGNVKKPMGGATTLLDNKQQETPQDQTTTV